MPNYFKERRDFLSKKRGKLVSQHKIAIAVDVTPAFVGMWEREESAPHLRMVSELAKVYEDTPEHIEQAIVALNRKIVARQANEPAAMR